MGAVVQYRDLPGGATELQFCDEVSEACLCTNCGMLSLSMFEDENHHVFCQTCLTERSVKYRSEYIHCKYESKEVSIFKMFEANDCINVIRKQCVRCPKPQCGVRVALEHLKEHYMDCLPTGTGRNCGRLVDTTEWSNHKKDGSEREACKTSCTRPNTEDSDKLTNCPHCERKIKERNMGLHLKACPKARLPCAYCGREFMKQDVKSHLTVCDKNPDSVPGQRKDRLRPTRRFEGSHIVPEEKSSSGGANKNFCPPPWPHRPSYRNISGWFGQLDAWLEENGITDESIKFAFLLKRTPESFHFTFHDLESQPNPYTEATVAALSFFRRQTPF